MSRNNFIGKTFRTNSPKETNNLGRNFGKVLGKGDVICLYGGLGSGKTTFIQGLAQGLGVKKKIISPTFIIMRKYKSRINDKGLGMNDFYHIDLYRTESVNDLIGLGLEEVLDDSSNIVVIEWAEKLKNLLPKKRIDVRFSYDPPAGGKNVRKITFGL